LDKNIEHNLDAPSVTWVTDNPEKKATVNINYDSKKYIDIDNSDPSYDPNDNLDYILTINVQHTNSAETAVREVVVRISNKLSVPCYVRTTADSASGSSVDLTNMYDSSMTVGGAGLPLAQNATMELVFTFWGPNDVTFNGGTSV